MHCLVPFNQDAQQFCACAFGRSPWLRRSRACVDMEASALGSKVTADSWPIIKTFKTMMHDMNAWNFVLMFNYVLYNCLCVEFLVRVSRRKWTGQRLQKFTIIRNLCLVEFARSGRNHAMCRTPLSSVWETVDQCQKYVWLISFIKCPKYCCLVDHMQRHSRNKICNVFVFATRFKCNAYLLKICIHKMWPYQNP